MNPFLKSLVVGMSLLSASTFADCESGLESFKKTLHPMLVQKCAQCHGDMGEETPHSVTDAVKSYNEIKKFIQFAAPDTSRLYRKVNQQHWLDKDPTATGATLDEVKALVNAWWEGGENSCPSSFPFQTEALSLPKPLPERDKGFAPMTWNYQGCEIALEIQKFSEAGASYPGSYRVRNPKIKCLNSMTKFSGMRIMINNQSHSFENIYEAHALELPASPDFKTISQELMILTEPTGSGDRAILIAFRNFQVTP